MMKSVRLIILVLINFVFSLQIFSQNKIELGTYLSEDKLTVINILPKNEVSYSRYNDISPFSENSTFYPKNQFCGTRLYEILESGFGKYNLKNNNLSIEFDQNVKFLDSVNIQTSVKTSKNEQIEFKFRIHSYPESEDENLINGVQINSSDNQVQLNSGLENEITLNLVKGNDDETYIIDDSYELTLNTDKSLIVDLYFNLYKKIITGKLKSKDIEMST
ncbi:hypothetical protein BC962_3220 [Gillisia mitskevichiae]|uniref:Uncharacterized protein n=1 Tax=Gillisia mitskevichiae TaxID=270921 RepID=A0A495NWV6_9FLAO|nr:hypothetical protein [Gillisia mitskevichiae]RKS42553.1 hypothetical protein BC962_3220 [Gillisia mitskevichiae]